MFTYSWVLLMAFFKLHFCKIALCNLKLSWLFQFMSEYIYAFRKVA